jgi:septal ring factor EnvC (AmiA/AmiB activator)
MGGQSGAEADIASPSGERAGAGRSETLYIEVREGDAPADPLMWFATDKG